MTTDRDWLKLLQAVGFDTKNQYGKTVVRPDGSDTNTWIHHTGNEIQDDQTVAEKFFNTFEGILALEEWVEKSGVELDIDQHGGTLFINRIKYYWGNRHVKHTNGYNINCNSKREAYIEAAFYRLENENA